MALTPEPSVRRRIAVFGSGLVLVGGLHAFARAIDAAPGVVSLFASLLAGLLAALVTGSLGEWVVHRYLMHRPLTRRFSGLPYDLHHVEHHWVQFPPDEYVQEDRVQRVPASGRKKGRVCVTGLGRVLVVASHVAFYTVFALGLSVLPAFLLAGNSAFAWTVTGTTGVFLFLFVHVHDAVHHPGLSPIERFGWFRFLDRHHYVHHVDTAANTNFLLPLGDWLLGTLRSELTEAECMVWPTYEQARSRVVRPNFTADGTKKRQGARSHALAHSEGRFVSEVRD